MADQARGDDPGGAVGDAEIGRFQHRVDVDRALHRVAHLGVVEGRRVDVHAEPDVGQRRLADQRGAGRRVGLVGRDRADADRGVVELARLEGDLGRLLVLDREDLDLLEAAGLAVPVRVAHEREALLGLPALDHIGPGGRRRLGRVAAARLLDRLLAHDATRARRQRARPERREGLLEHDHSGILVAHLDVVELGEVVGVLRLLGRIGDALVAELDVVGGHLAEAVREHDARPQGELDMRRVDLLDRRRPGRPPAPNVADLVVDQLGVDAAHDVALGLRLAVRRVEHLEIGIGAHPEHAALLGEAEARPRRRSHPEGCAALEQGAAGETKPLHDRPPSRPASGRRPPQALLLGADAKPKDPARASRFAPCRAEPGCGVCGANRGQVGAVLRAVSAIVRQARST